MTFKAFVLNSNISQEDKNLWFSILEVIDDSQTRTFENFIENQEEKLRLLTENLKTKQRAFQDGDKAVLEKILQQEESVSIIN